MTTANEEAIGEGGGEPLTLLSWILHGQWRDLAAFVGEATDAGWNLRHSEDLSIKGGEREWWTLARMSAPEGKRLPKLRVTKSGTSCERVNLLARKGDIDALLKALAGNWRLTFLGHDGGWGGEPHYRLRRRSRPK